MKVYHASLSLLSLIFFLVTNSCNLNSGNIGPYIWFKELPDEKKIEVYFDDDLFTSYLYSEGLEKPILYPLISQGGNPLTRGFPIEPRPGESTGHPHQIGFWFNYGDVNGLDFWNNSPDIPDDQKHRFGHIVHQELINAKEGRKQGVLEVSALWENYENEVLLTEKTVFVFSSDSSYRIIDRITTLTAIDKEVLFRDNKEGMVGIRVNRELELPSERPGIFIDSAGEVATERTISPLEPKGNYLSSEGLSGEGVWGKRARWVALSGVVNNEEVTLAIIDHPSNVGYPTYWHARGYGLFAANPLGQADFSEGIEVLNFRLPAGESQTFRYRLVIHSGKIPEPQLIEDFYEDFKNL